jgi:hypothetical protein
MVASSLVFLTPLGAIAMLALVLPLAALGLVARRESRARRALGLPAPPPTRRLGRTLALVAVPVVLGLAAMQPALRTTRNAHVRTDAQAYFVVDVSRSMLASAGPGRLTRLERARRLAIAVRNAIPEVPSGIATITDRALPDLFPTSDLGVFDLTMMRAVAIEQPPPILDAVVASKTDAVSSLETQNFFSPSAKRRVVVLLTDGESRGYDPGPVAHALASSPGAKLVVVHVWSADESVYDGRHRETAYHVDPSSTAKLDALAAAAGTHVLGDKSAGAVEKAVQSAIGAGPVRVEGRTVRTRTLAPYVALLALVPLLLVLPRLSLRGLVTALRLVAASWLRRARDLVGRRRKPSPSPAGVAG